VAFGIPLAVLPGTSPCPGPGGDTAGNIPSRAQTAASVAWTPPGWPTVAAAGTAQRTPSLVPLIQEIVNRPGWASGNALALIPTGTGKRVAEAFEGAAAGAPLLHLEYR
jgi:hypothetical protein